MENNESHKKIISISPQHRRYLYSTTIILAIILFLIFSFNKYVLSPPDLSKCNRFNIQFCPPLFEFFQGSVKAGLLNDEEVRYIDSITTTEVTDLKIIRKFSEILNTCSFKRFSKSFEYDNHIKVDCYNEEKIITSLIVGGEFVLTKYNCLYKCKSCIGDSILPSEIWPLIYRDSCAIDNLQHLWLFIFGFSIYNTSPEPNQWCDIIVNRAATQLLDDAISITEIFKCPSAKEGKCNYAMNPNCTIDSPDDMVLLFEAKAGWNQYGGPELFIFDNHNPKGGCVLLRNGMIKFIRTEKELNNLRWK